MSTEDNKPKKMSVKEFIGKGSITLVKKEIIGILTLLSVGLVGLVGTFLHVSLDLSSGANYAETAKSLHGPTVLFMIFSFIAITGIFMLWSRLSSKMERAKVEQQNMKLDAHEIGKEIRKFRILPAIICGAFISLMLFAILEIVWVFIGVDETNPASIIAGFKTGSVIVIATIIGSIAAIGALVPKLSSFYDKFRDSFHKHHVDL